MGQDQATSSPPATKPGPLGSVTVGKSEDVHKDAKDKQDDAGGEKRKLTEEPATNDEELGTVKKKTRRGGGKRKKQKDRALTK